MPSTYIRMLVLTIIVEALESKHLSSAAETQFQPFCLIEPMQKHTRKRFYCYYDVLIFFTFDVVFYPKEYKRQIMF